MYAAEHGNKKVVDLLVSKGCDLSVVDDQGRNILHAACHSDNVDIVENLLSREVGDIESRDKTGKTPVMYAVQHGNKKVVDLLVSKGCDLSVVDDQGRNILHAACHSDNVDIVENLLSREVGDIESRDKTGKTPVMYAVQHGNKKVVDLLVRHGCNLSVVNDLGRNILHAACLSDNVDIVENLLSRGIAEIDGRDRMERTPVMYAAEKGNKKVFDLLVSKGCNLSVVDDQGRNILHAACLSDNVDIVEYLLSRGIADMESRGEDGNTPVMYAAEQGNRKVVDLLVSKGCNLMVVDDLGRNILHAACLSDNPDIVDDLLSRGITDIESKDRMGRTPVMYAAEQGNEKVLDLLVSRGCNLMVVDDRGRNILHAACLSDNTDIVDDLLSRGITDIESKDRMARTPVMYAAQKGNRKVVDLLVSKGCNLSVPDDRGRNIIHTVCLSDNTDIVEDLLCRGIADTESTDGMGRTPVMYAAAEGNGKVVDLLVSKGCNLSAVDDLGRNIIHAACLAESVDIVQDLLSHGIVEIESKDRMGRTPVMYAAEQGNKKVLDLLVSRGCNLSVVDDQGRNILHAACLSDNVDIVDYLLSLGIADIESRGEGGDTPVMYAAEQGNKKVVNLLVSKGCNLSIVDDLGRNILHVACLSDNVDIVENLLSREIVDTESRDRMGATPVMYAAEQGNKKVLDLLVSKGCNLSVVDDLGRNILHAACLSDNIDIVEDLLSHGIADIESGDSVGRTPVMYAAEKGNRKVVDLLVSKGCNLSIVDDLGRNMLHVAFSSDNVDIAEDLDLLSITDIESRDRIGRTPVMHAVEKGNKKGVDLLVSKGCNLTVVDDLGRNILHVACLNDNADIAESLLSRGVADIDSKDKKGTTPVMYAAEQGNKKVVDLLVSKGCNLSALEHLGRSIIHAACLSGNVSIVVDLLSHGIADIDSKDRMGRTPVMYAATKGNKKVVDLLVSKGCNLSVVDDLGRNILHEACCGDNVGMVEDLLSRGIADMGSRDSCGKTPVMYAAQTTEKKVLDFLVNKGYHQPSNYS
ncbi:serine/threonine-protein phosphatase 6 regulatory ankyrin repeat subunit A-like [Haliotis asinina]|uniref:serine/threonine-protein phosphatase 6 regulatory ankyrin repeat subunit A-like n=1 Tax=Haliotis asinina TaxID=109174 RepID=UPI00353276AC